MKEPDLARRLLVLLSEWNKVEQWQLLFLAERLFGQSR